MQPRIARRTIGALGIVPSFAGCHGQDLAGPALAEVEATISGGGDPDRARNVILFVGDGMGVSTVSATRVFSVGVGGELVMDQLPYAALSRTADADHITADSASTMTAMMTGVAANSGVIATAPRPSTPASTTARPTARSTSRTCASVTDVFGRRRGAGGLRFGHVRVDQQSSFERRRRHGTEQGERRVEGRPQDRAGHDEAGPRQ